jgi:hypothetical protein
MNLVDFQRWDAFKILAGPSYLKPRKQKKIKRIAQMLATTLKQTIASNVHFT